VKNIIHIGFVLIFAVLCYNIRGMQTEIASQRTAHGELSSFVGQMITVDMSLYRSIQGHTTHITELRSMDNTLSNVDNMLLQYIIEINPEQFTGE